MSLVDTSTASMASRRSQPATASIKQQQQPPPPNIFDDDHDDAHSTIGGLSSSKSIATRSVVTTKQEDNDDDERTRNSGAANVVEFSQPEFLVRCRCEAARNVSTLLQCLKDVSATGSASEGQAQQRIKTKRTSTRHRMQPVTVFCTPNGLTFHVSTKSKQSQASVEWPAALCSYYELCSNPNPNPNSNATDPTQDTGAHSQATSGGEFCVNLTTLLDCLSIVVDTSTHAPVEMSWSYSLRDEILRMELDPHGASLGHSWLCTTAIPGMVPPDDLEFGTTHTHNMVTAFSSHPVAARILAPSSLFQGIITELQMTAGATTVSIRMGYLRSSVHRGGGGSRNDTANGARNSPSRRHRNNRLVLEFVAKGYTGQCVMQMTDTTGTWILDKSAASLSSKRKQRRNRNSTSSRRQQGGAIGRNNNEIYDDNNDDNDNDDDDTPTFIEHSYSLGCVLQAMKPLEMAQETCLSINARGMMAVQHQILFETASLETEDTPPAFCDFVICSLHDDDDDEEDNEDEDEEEYRNGSEEDGVAAEHRYRETAAEAIRGATGVAESTSWDGDDGNDGYIPVHDQDAASSATPRSRSRSQQPQPSQQRSVRAAASSYSSSPSRRSARSKATAAASTRTTRTSKSNKNSSKSSSKLEPEDMHDEETTKDGRQHDQVDIDNSTMGQTLTAPSDDDDMEFDPPVAAPLFGAVASLSATQHAPSATQRRQRRRIDRQSARSRQGASGFDGEGQDDGGRRSSTTKTAKTRRGQRMVNSSASPTTPTTPTTPKSQLNTPTRRRTRSMSKTKSESGRNVRYGDLDEDGNNNNNNDVGNAMDDNAMDDGEEETEDDNMSIGLLDNLDEDSDDDDDDDEDEDDDEGDEDEENEFEFAGDGGEDDENGNSDHDGNGEESTGGAPGSTGSRRRPGSKGSKGSSSTNTSANRRKNRRRPPYMEERYCSSPEMVYE